MPTYNKHDPVKYKKPDYSEWIFGNIETVNDDGTYDVSTCVIQKTISPEYCINHSITINKSVPEKNIESCEYESSDIIMAYYEGKWRDGYVTFLRENGYISVSITVCRQSYNDKILSSAIGCKVTKDNIRLVHPHNKLTDLKPYNELVHTIF